MVRKGCVECGTEFEAKGNVNACSPECNKKRKARQVQKTETCKQCGEKKTTNFIGKGENRKCQKCYDKDRFQETSTCTQCGDKKTTNFHGKGENRKCQKCYDKDRFQETSTCTQCGDKKTSKFYGKGEDRKCKKCYLQNRKKDQECPQNLIDLLIDLDAPPTTDRTWEATIEQRTWNTLDRFYLNGNIPDPRIAQMSARAAGKAAENTTFHTLPYTKVVCSKTQQGSFVSNIVSIPHRPSPHAREALEEALDDYVKAHSAELAVTRAADSATVDPAAVTQVAVGYVGASVPADIVEEDAEVRAELKLLSVPVDRTHQQVVRVSHLFEMQDLRTERALRLLQGETVAPVQYRNRLFVPDPHTVDPNHTRGPLTLVFLRSSGQLAPAQVNLHHLQNLLAAYDWEDTRHQEEAADPALPPTPASASIVSFVHEQPAWHPMPVYPNVGNNAVQQHFYQVLERAHAQGREVRILARGISGFSTFPDAFRPILARFSVGPNPLVVRFAVAMRHNFVTHADCCLPAQPHPYPFGIIKNDPPNQRGYHHTALVNVLTIHDEFHGRFVDAAAARINTFHWEETAARIGAMVPWLSQFVKNVRGAFRNRNVA